MSFIKLGTIQLNWINSLSQLALTAIGMTEAFFSSPFVMSIAASQPMIYRKALWKLSEQLTKIREVGGDYKAMDFS